MGDESKCASFAPAHRGECGYDFLIAYSCKGRRVCPACTARRMVGPAARLADHAMPRLPLCQWELSVPKRLHHFLQNNPRIPSLRVPQSMSLIDVNASRSNSCHISRDSN